MYNIPIEGSTVLYRNIPDAVSIDKTRSLIMELDAKGILEECESWYVYMCGYICMAVYLLILLVTRLG